MQPLRVISTTKHRRGPQPPAGTQVTGIPVRGHRLKPMLQSRPRFHQMSQQLCAHHHLENSTPLKHAPEGIYVAYPLGDPPLPRIEETDWCEPCTPEETRQHAYLFVAKLA